jgi:hypothetical protein
MFIITTTTTTTTLQANVPAASSFNKTTVAAQRDASLKRSDAAKKCGAYINNII